MGLEASKPILPETTQNYQYIGKYANSLPYKIPDGHPIQSINISKNRINCIPNNLPNLKYLNISDNKIEKINNEMIMAFQNYESLQTLDFHNNGVSQFPIKISNLLELDISQNKLDNFPPLNSVLQKLNLDCNRISILNFSSTTLTFLSLRMNCITIIDSNIRLPNLNVLDLSMNSLTNIPNLTIICPNLTNLFLQHNLLTEINSPFPKNLVEIDLSDNLLTALPPNISSLKKLQSLAFEHNHISSFPKLHSKIARIYANNNDLTVLPSFNGRHLNQIDFQENHITTFPNFNPTNYCELILYKNEITSIPIELIPNSVTIIDLQNCRIRDLPPELFKLLSLKTLLLDHNQITSIPEEVSNSHIFTLGISENPLRTLPPMPQCLETLTACNCLIETIGDIFVNCRNLKNLSLCNNMIKEIPPKLKVSSAYFSQNQISDIPFFSSFLIELDISYNNIKELNPNIVFPALHYIDLSYNQISQPPNEFLMRQKKLQIVRLTGNPIFGPLILNGLQTIDTIDIVNTNIMQITCDPPPKECIISNPDFTQKILHRKTFITAPLTSGYAEIVGMRSEMEDSIIVRDDLGLYVICDGHGGSETARFGTSLMVELFQKALVYNETIMRTYSVFISTAIKEKKTKGGSTMIACLFHGNSIIWANIGDSRAMIVKSNGQSEKISEDHKPYVRSEFERIRDEGGFVSDNRVNGDLAVARSLGDQSKIAVSSWADISTYQIKPEDKFLVLGCDGVFDVLTNDDIACLISPISKPNEAAYLIRNVAYARGSTDNISVIVVAISHEKK